MTDPVSILITVALLAFFVFVLVRGAGLFIEGAQGVGEALGMSSFAVGVIIAGFGTSFPELAAGIAAVFQGTTEIVVANAVGSNITNILLVVGASALIGGRIVIKRDLLKSELPIFFISTVLFLSIIFDGTVDRVEAMLLAGTFGAYLWYLFVEAKEEDQVKLKKQGRRPRLEVQAIVFLFLGLFAVLIGAHFSVKYVIELATLFEMPVGVVSIVAIALGTSLPELSVAMKAVKEGRGDFAVGSIFGSNSFNILLVVGIPGLFVPLAIGDEVREIGMQILIAASLILFVSALAKRVMRWEGAMLLIFFAFFLIKLLSFCTACVS